MPKLPVLSGREVIDILSRAGFTVARQRGSHIVLAKIDESGKHAIVVPNHGEIDRGTLGISSARQASAGQSCSDWLNRIQARHLPVIRPVHFS
jgi:predicted RNA binding protein YcfA (HicA-like mRNA interferase family)